MMILWLGAGRRAKAASPRRARSSSSASSRRRGSIPARSVHNSNPHGEEPPKAASRTLAQTPAFAAILRDALRAPQDEGLSYFSDTPPSITSSMPVTYFASSLAR